jgi:hypothetical protein
MRHNRDNERTRDYRADARNTAVELLFRAPDGAGLDGFVQIRINAVGLPAQPADMLLDALL